MTGPTKDDLNSMDYISDGQPNVGDTNASIDLSGMDFISDGQPFVQQSVTVPIPSFGWAASGYGFESTELSGAGYGFGSGLRAYGWEQP